MSEEAAVAAANTKSPVGMMMLVGGILVAEAVVIIGAMTLLGGSTEVEPTGPNAILVVPEDEKIQEVLVLDSRLPNNKLGKPYLYDVEIYVQVKARYAMRVNDELQQFRNEMKAELTALWRTTDPREFQEPKLESLNRKVFMLLNDRFGVDTEHSEPIISKCVIVMGMGFPIDA